MDLRIVPSYEQVNYTWRKPLVYRIDRANPGRLALGFGGGHATARFYNGSRGQQNPDQRAAAMPPTCRNRCRRRLAGRLFAGLTLAAYLTASAGFAMPVLPHKDRSQPFPCQDHACGCKSAEECWRHCCCFTPEEKLAWAKAHDVEPPPYAEKPSADGWRAAPLRNQAQSGEGPHAGCSCCSHAKDHPTSISASCCARAAQSGKQAPAVPVLAPLRCHGLTTLWIALGTAPPPPAVALELSPPVTDWLSYPDASAPVLGCVPPDPPPRSHVAAS
jgi:hypothetical protein